LSEAPTPENPYAKFKSVLRTLPVGASDVALEVTGEPAMVADPADRSLDDPARQHDEAALVAAASNLRLSPPASLHGSRHGP
jgi:hypothetical protein